jgi:hypothetical protein
VAPTVERYREALREAEWWLDETWEPDVPHAAVVGQALSAAEALGHDHPPDWPDRLDSALEQLGRRQTKYRLGGDPSLLAATLRGLAVVSATPPEWLLQAASDVLHDQGSVEATAELAEALARHRRGQQLLPDVLAAAFSGSNDDDPDAAYARWWLLGRREDMLPRMNVAVVENARLQALAAATPRAGKAAAMAMEAAARAAGDLVIASAGVLSADRSRRDRSVLVSRALYRGAFFALLLIGGLLDLHGLAQIFAAHGHAHIWRQCLAGVFVAALGLCVSGTANAAARAFEKPPPEWARYGELIATVMAGIIGAVIN